MSSLRDRLQQLRSRGSAGEQKASAVAEARQAETGGRVAKQSIYKVKRQDVIVDMKRYQTLKAHTHRELLDTVDLSILKELDKEEVAAQIRQVAGQILDKGGATLSSRERQELLEEIVDEVIGFGPLEPLLKDASVSDILVNGAKQIYVERFGRLQLTDVEFRDDKHLLQIIERIVASVGRHIDESSPMCDARLPDGSRVNAIIPPLAIDYPVLSIRKFRRDVLTIDELVQYGSLTEEIGMLFEAAVKSRLNILISGGTGSGKTTLLNVLSRFIPEDQRIVTIEDSAELQLQQPHVVRLETRPPNIEGRGEVTQYELLRNSLRMRPDRIIVGEVRGKEVLDMLQAMNTGHDGSMCTIHANSPRDALSRMETMIAMSGLDLPPKAMRQQIASAIDIIVQQQRLSDGTRKVTHFTEVLDTEGDIVSMQDIFVLQRHGIDAEGRVIAEHVPTGVQPRFLERMKASGVTLPLAIFIPNK